MDRLLDGIDMTRSHTRKLGDHNRSMAEEVRESTAAMQPGITTIPSDFLGVNRANSNIMRQPRVPPSDPSVPKFTRIPPDNPSWRPHREDNNSYSSVGHIPTLPKSSSNGSNFGAVPIMKIYSSEYKRFAGTGKLSENFA